MIKKDLMVNMLRWVSKTDLNICMFILQNGIVELLNDHMFVAVCNENNG